MFKFLLPLFLFFLHSTKAKEYKPSSSSELQSAFNQANPGDTIQLQALDYYGDFVLQRSGTALHPIKIIGAYSEDGTSATGLIGNTTTLFLKGSYFNVQNLNITGGEEGLYLESDHSTLTSLSFYALRQTMLVEGNSNTFGSISISNIEDGIFLRGNDNRFRDISINTAKSGIIIESGNKTRLHNMAIHDSDGKILSLVLNEGTCCGRVSNTIYDGLVEIKGDRYNFRQTVANGAINVLGCGNSFGRSVFGITYFTTECENDKVTSNIWHFPQDKATLLKDL